MGRGIDRSQWLQNNRFYQYREAYSGLGIAGQISLLFIQWQSMGMEACTFLLTFHRKLVQNLQSMVMCLLVVEGGKKTHGIVLAPPPSSGAVTVAHMS